MIAHQHPDFPSDVFTILESVGATLIVGKYTNLSCMASVTGRDLTQLGRELMNEDGRWIFNFPFPFLCLYDSLISI